MHAATSCPDALTLEKFLLGQTPEELADELERHLSLCSRCAAELAKVTADDPLVAAMRAAAATISGNDAPLVRAVAPLLKQMFSQKDTLPPTASLSSQVTRSAGGDKTPASLSFLAPARQAGELGRLGPYRIIEVLGAGGMGVVLRAEDPRLKRTVAIKVIKAGLDTGDEARQRFLHEAQAAANIEHDNIVAVYEVNEDRGTPYLVMPLLRGQTLESRLRDAAGPLPLAELLDFGRQVAEGLSAAHTRGLVHRDIKPGNIFLVSGGVVSGEWSNSPTADSPLTTHHSPLTKLKILDFGLVQALAGNPVESQAGAIVGTPAYMAPEQARRDRVDGRADLFSFGCVLYQMATGRQPFAAADLLSTLVRIAADMPPPPRELNPRLPVELNNLILRLLAKEPDERPADAATVAHELRTLEQRLFGALVALAPLALAACLLLATGTTLTLWLNQTPPDQVAPVEPGAITFITDEPALRVILQPIEGAATEIDVKQAGEHALPPGDYVLKPASEVGKRKLWPERLQVKAGDKKSISLSLVGEVRAYKGHGGAVTGVAMPAKGGLLVLSAGGTDRSVAVWDAAKNALVHSLEGHQGTVLCVAVSADGTRAVSGSGGKNQPPDLTVRVWDLTNGKETACFRGHERTITAVSLTPDGKQCLSGDAGGSVLLWETAGGNKALPLKGHLGRVNGVALSADGKLAASAGEDGLVQLAKTDMGALVNTFDTKGVAIAGVAFAPDGQWLALACGDGSVRLWDWKADTVRSWKAHTGSADCVAVSPDGKRVLSGGADGLVRLAADSFGEEQYTFTGHTKAVRGVAFAADGKHAASGSADQSVRLWRLPD